MAGRLISLQGRLRKCQSHDVEPLVSWLSRLITVIMLPDHHDQRYDKGTKLNKNRLEAFSDGVFAVAITLLVLDIRIPANIEYGDLPASLVKLIPKLLSYLLSFFVVGVYWSYHHFALSRIRKIDGTLLFLNLLTLLLVTFLPFPTMLIGEYPFTTIPLVIYGLCLLASNFIGLLWVLHLHRHPECLEEVHRPEFLKTQLPVYAFVNVPYLVAVALSFYVPWVSYVIYVLVLVLVGGMLSRQMGRSARAVHDTAAL